MCDICGKGRAQPISYSLVCKWSIILFKVNVLPLWEESDVGLIPCLRLCVYKSGEVCFTIIYIYNN